MSSLVLMPSSPFTRTWLPATVPASGPSTCASPYQSTQEPSSDIIIISQILKVVEIEKSDDVRRPYIKQLLVPDLKFPLPHRVSKTRSMFAARRPATF